MTKIYNKKTLKYFRRHLRSNGTSFERILWRHLKNKKLSGYRFLRQYSVDNYILDFFCPKAKLAIELDGSQHLEKETAEYDRMRTIHLESYNIRVLRFQNNEVKKKLNEVLTTIFSYLKDS